MSHQNISDRLNDYVDGTLPADVSRQVDAHLTACASCRDEVARLRKLVTDAAALPQSIEPPRDLWTDIAPRLSGEGLRTRTLWSMRHALAAAALVLVVLSSAVTFFIIRDGEGRITSGPVASGVPQTTYLLIQFRQTEAEYLRAAVELEEALRAAKTRLAPETVELVERNLRIIDAAIEESRAALAADPANRDILEMLSRRYQNKLDLLQQVSRLSAQS